MTETAQMQVSDEVAITIQNMNKWYGTFHVLRDINLTVQRGERIVICGPSGSGKSTLVRCLSRLIEPTAGEVLIDGQDLAGLTQDSVRAEIAMVTQDTSLLHRSVRDNIIFGRPDATEEQLLDAARRAEAHDFIQELCDSKGRKGYSAHVGERGVSLSGGQRQRIAIARVLLKDAPILVLDEATSALDSATEAAVQDALDEASKGLTTLMVAHRLSTVQNADEIVVLKAGQVIERGTHDALLAADGEYADMWARQAKRDALTVAAAE